MNFGLNAFMRTLAVTQKLFDLSVEWSIFRLHSMCSKLRLPVSEALPEVWALEGGNNVMQWHKANQNEWVVISFTILPELTYWDHRSADATYRPKVMHLLQLFWYSCSCCLCWHLASSFYFVVRWELALDSNVSKGLIMPEPTMGKKIKFSDD